MCYYLNVHFQGQRIKQSFPKSQKKSFHYKKILLSAIKDITASVEIITWNTHINCVGKMVFE